jgi:hypothetical protein
LRERVTSGPSWASVPVDRIGSVATIRPILQQAQDFADMYNRNLAYFEHAARIANQMAPTIRMIEQMAPTAAIMQRMQRDMNVAAILARQQSAFAAMLPAIPVPTEAELVETQDRMAELVPEADEQREQVAEQAAEIQADPQGKQLIEQLTGWVNEVMARLGDIGARHKTGIGLFVLGWLVLFVIPPADDVKAGLFFAAAAAWMQYKPPPSDK